MKEKVEIVSRMPTRYVIMDVDVGSDDAWAMFMMLKAERELNFKLLAVTCVAGNTTLRNVARNVARVLQCAGRTDIPVFLGAAKALIGSPLTLAFHGKDGLGNIKHKAPDMSVIQTENAVHALNRLVNQYPKEITLICCGPLTNIALALRMYEDFGSNLHTVHLMGGNCRGVGNISNCAEFNFYTDVEAAHILFSSVQCPITMVPWEACDSKFKIPMKWRTDVLGAIDHRYTRFMNPIEASVFSAGETTWESCDSTMVACLLWPKRVIRQQRTIRCTVELQGGHTRGQLVIDQGFGSPITNTVNLIEEVNVDAVMEVFRWTLDAESIQS